MRTFAGIVMFLGLFLILLAPCTYVGITALVTGEWLLGLGLLAVNVVMSGGLTIQGLEGLDKALSKSKSRSPD